MDLGPGPSTLLLERPVPEGDGDTRALIEEARQRHRRRRSIALATAAFVLLVVGIGVVALRQSGGRGGTATSPGRIHTGVFPHATGVVLVFADGLSLDLDHRAADRQPIAGQRAGDQRWDIVRAGNSLVAGWGEVWATSIADRSSRRLGPVVTFTPAAEPGAVWLVNYPGGRIGQGTPTLREVSTKGTTLVSEQGPPPSAGVPAIGIPGGLAFTTSSGVALWNAAAHRFTRRLGNQAGFVGDAAGNNVAWCEGLCTSLHVTDLTGRDRVFASPQAGWWFDPDSMRLSPDGRFAAVITQRTGLGTANEQGALDVVDTRTGHITVVRHRLSAWSNMTWTGDGPTLYVASDTAQGMTISRYSIATGQTETARVPFENAEQFVILKRTEARSFLASAPGGSKVCPSQSIEPGVPSPLCGPSSF